MKDTINIKMRDISKNDKTSSGSNFHNLKIKYSKSTKYYNTKKSPYYKYYSKCLEIQQQQQQRLIPLGGVGYMDQLPP